MVGFKLKLPDGSSKSLPSKLLHTFDTLNNYVLKSVGSVKIMYMDNLIDDDITLEMVPKNQEIELQCVTVSVEFLLVNNNKKQYHVEYMNESFEDLKLRCCNICECEISELFYLNNEKIVLYNDSSLVSMINHFRSIPTSQRKLFYYSENVFIVNKVKDKYKCSTVTKRSCQNGNTLYLCKPPCQNNSNELHTIVKVKKGFDLHDAMREYVKTFILDHPNIVKIIDIPFTERDQDDKIYSFYQMPYYEDGCLKTLMNAQQNHFDEVTLLIIALKLCSAIKYIQSKNIIHCDIRPENIFISKKKNMMNGTMDYDIVLGDFEYAMFVSSTKSINQVFGTPYPAPEVLSKKYYSFESDIYSFGLTLLQLSCGKISAKKNLSLNSCYSKQFNRIIVSMIHENPNKRPSIDVIFMQFSKLAINCIHKDAVLLEYILPDLKKDRDFVIQAIKSNILSYHYIDPSLSNDKEILDIINPFKCNPLLEVETTFSEKVDLLIKPSKEFNSQLDAFKSMNESQHHTIGIIGNQQIGKSSFLNRLIGEPIFKVSTNNQQTTVGVDFVVRKSNDGMTNMYIDCEGHNSVERRTFFTKQLTQASTEKKIDLMSPLKTQNEAHALMKKFNLKISLLLYRICNVLLIYCNTDNVDDLAFLEDLSNVSNIDSIEKKPSLVLLIRQKYLEGKKYSLDDFAERKDQVLGNYFSLFSTVQYFAVPEFFDNNNNIESAFQEAKSLILNNMSYYSNMKYFIDYSICKAIELCKDENFLVSAHLDPEYLILLKKYARSEEDVEKAEDFKKAEDILEHLITIYENSYGSISYVKQILSKIDEDCSTMTKQGKALQDNVKNGGMLKTVSNSISLGSGLAAIFFPPVAALTIISSIGGIIVDIRASRLKRSNCEDIEKTIGALRDSIEVLNNNNKKIEESVQSLSKYDMTLGDIEDFQYLYLISKSTNDFKEMKKKELAQSIMNLIELRETADGDEKYQKYFETVNQLSSPQSNLKIRPNGIFSSIGSAVQAYAKNVAKETMQNTIKFCTSVGGEFSKVKEGERITKALFKLPRKHAPIIREGLQTAQKYSKVVQIAKTVQGLFVLIDIVSLGFSVKDWASGDSTMENALNEKLTEFKTVKDEISTYCDELEKTISSLEEKKSSINAQLANIHIYQQIMNIYPNTHFRLISKYKHVLGFMYKYLDTELLREHLTILNKIAKNDANDENVVLLDILINEIESKIIG